MSDKHFCTKVIGSEKWERRSNLRDIDAKRVWICHLWVFPQELCLNFTAMWYFFQEKKYNLKFRNCQKQPNYTCINIFWLHASTFVQDLHCSICYLVPFSCICWVCLSCLHAEPKLKSKNKLLKFYVFTKIYRIFYSDAVEKALKGY